MSGSKIVPEYPTCLYFKFEGPFNTYIYAVSSLRLTFPLTRAAVSLTIYETADYTACRSITLLAKFNDRVARQVKRYSYLQAD